MVEAHPKWRARVVYGDTDSLFVMVPGRSQAAAFKIGAEIARSVTAANPSPITLKLEKVLSGGGQVLGNFLQKQMRCGQNKLR